MNGVVIGGTRSGVGKTVATLAIVRALQQRGHTVQPAKAGPDFIDPSHHERVAGRPSRTLDRWLQGEDGLRRNYYRGDGDVCVVEGVMGLYDGDGSSTAMVTELLDLPVVLVVDANAGMESVAATALGLATPAATMVGTTLGAQNDVLFKGGDILERVRDTDTVIFDKTGTLTKGEMSLTDVIVLDEERAAINGGTDAAADGGQLAPRETVDEDFVLRVAASAESGSEHPLAEAIVQGAEDRGLEVETPDEFENVPGHGIRATIGDGEVLVGNRKLLRDNGIDPSPVEDDLERLENNGKTAMLVALNNQLLGIVADADTIKESATEAIAQLRERDIDVWMITGDNERTARAVAEQVGIAPDNVQAEVLPEDKADVVEAIQSAGRRVMMVGDGVNDAPALAAAYVGTAIGSGTDVAIEAADVTLMRDDPLDVLKAIRISAGTLSKVKQNLGWALVYNTALIPLASLGLLQPVLAAAAMAFSSVSVLTNTLLFRRYTPDHDYKLFGLFR